MRKGFTLMELVIVLAVLAIIAAILIPTFLTTTTRARLRADIQSAHTIENAMALYHAEHGRAPGTNIDEVLDRLITVEQLREKPTPQTAGAEWLLRGNHVWVDITALDANGVVHRVSRELTADEQARVYRGSVHGGSD